MNLPACAYRGPGPRHRVPLLAAAILGGLALVHCGAVDSDMEASAAPADTSPDASTSEPDAFFNPPDAGDAAEIGAVAPPDASGDSGGGGLDVPTRMFFVHAGANVFPVRLCYELDGVMQPRLPLPDDPDRPMPLTNYPGIAPGSAYEMVEMDGLLEQAVEVTPVAVRADVWEVARAVDGADDPLDCTQLVCPAGQGGCLGDDPNLVVRLPTLSVESLYANPIELLVMSGCLGQQADDPGSVERCGTGFDAVEGNLETHLLSFFPADASEPDKVGILVAQLSPSIDATLAASTQGELLVELGDLGDPSSRRLLTSNQPLMTVQPPVSAAWLDLPAGLDGYGNKGFVAQVVDGPTVVRASVSLSLADVQALSEPSSLPEAYYGSSRSFVFALMGDVTAEPASAGTPGGGLNPDYDGRGLHILAIPTTMRTAVE